jgi:hypothetical protein
VAGALTTHDRQHGPLHGQGAEHIDLIDGSDRGVGSLLDGAEQAAAGVVHQHVDPAERVDRRLDRLGRLVGIGDIEVDRE